MVQETKPASGKDYPQNGAADEEIEIRSENTFGDRVAQIMEKFASTSLGQIMIEKADRTLKVIEQAAKWSLPQSDDGGELERPLPWIFFLFLIVSLRIFRIWYSCIANIMGFRLFTPQYMVQYFQKQRRHLRALRIQGLKMRNSRDSTTTVKHTTNRSTSFMDSLRNLFSSIRLLEAPPARRVFQQYGGNVRIATDKDPAAHNLTLCEMLDAYANEDSDNDSDYVPQDDDNDADYDSMSSPSTTESAEEVEKEEEEELQPQQVEEKSVNNNQNENIKTQKEFGPEKEITTEMKKNGEKEYHPKPQPLDEIQNEILIKADSESEQMHTPKEIPEINGAFEAGESHELTVVTPNPAAADSASASRTSLHHLAAPQFDESSKKSTPGHETAASLKPHSSKVIEAEKKSYRTITTQTAIELDWTVTIKTEITYKKPYPKLERINCSVNLTPASSTEDIFYSPMGSLQDFHSIFHPAPLVKGSPGEAETSTHHDAAAAVSDDGASSVSPENQTSNQKKNFNHFPHNKNRHSHHNNAKYRFKNRR